MGINARTLKVRDFRSYEAYELALSEGVTVLAGPNAAGKTNLVEALQLLTAGQSFRRPSPADLVRTGASRAEAALLLEGDGRRLDMGLGARPPLVQPQREARHRRRRPRRASERPVLPRPPRHDQALGERPPRRPR